MACNMGSRPLGRLLLRPTSFARPPVCETCNVTRISPSWTASRCISSSQARRKEGDAGSEPPKSGQSAQSQETLKQDPASAINSLLSGKPPQRRQSAFSPRNQMSSGDEVRAARANHIFGAAFADPSRTRPSRSPPRLNFDNMDLPESILDPKLSNKPSDAASLQTQQEETFANYPTLNATYGRQVALDASRGRDLVRGIGMLGSLVARNKIKRDMQKQRFHERPGLKRKRLHSERWRARFKKNFTAVTRRVSELTRKGW